jgi:uroporphyrinogen decarboxylase
MADNIKINADPCFERLRKTLMLEGKPDRVPLANFGVASNIVEYVLGHKLHKIDYSSGGKVYAHDCTAREWVDFWIKSGYDYVEVRPSFKFTIKNRYDKEGAASNEGVGVIQTLEDLKSEKWPWQKEEEWGFEHIIEVAELMPQEMKLIVSTHDIFTAVWENMGFTNFCNCLYECPELVEELFSQIGEAVYRINVRTAELVGNKIGALWYQDDLAFNTGTLVNPNVYRKNLFPWVQKIGEIARKLDIPFMYHSDGKLWSLFDDFHALGVNAIHPLEPKSMDAVEVKEKQGHRFCLIGNIDLDLLSRGTPEDVDEMVRDRISKLGYNGGYVVGTSNTVPYYVNPINYKTMIESTFRYGIL